MESDTGNGGIAISIPADQINGNPKSHRGSLPTPTTGRDGSKGSDKAPERKLTVFAFRLALLEKASSSLGKLCFIWATVVLLGGFATGLDEVDFWAITTIILMEGTRIFCRSHELEWQNHATGSPTDRATRWCPWLRAARANRRAERVRANSVSEHYARRVTLQVSGVTMSFTILQIVSALGCISLSLWRILAHFIHGQANDNGNKNQESAVILFYVLALAQALVFIIEKAYYTVMMEYKGLLAQICIECCLSLSEIGSIKRFFYDSYSQCIHGSIFDGLKMDLVSFAKALLLSDSREERRMGVVILHELAMNRPSAAHTLREIGGSRPVLERLTDILNRKNPEGGGEEIRLLVGEIVAELVREKQNAIRVSEIPGAMESISSMLYKGETNHRFSVLGLLILKRLAHDQNNCWKMYNARGLVPRIIDFTYTSKEGMSEKKPSESVQHSLDVVKMLVSASGQTGSLLRREIAEIVSTVSNIRTILQYGKRHVSLQRVGIEILTNLAKDEEARGRIGRTGGIIKVLLEILIPVKSPLRVEAEAALATLTLENETNCNQIWKKRDVMVELMSTLRKPGRPIIAARILRNLFAYGKMRTLGWDLISEASKGAAHVLTQIMDDKCDDRLILQEFVGIAKQLFKIQGHERTSALIENIGIDRIAEKLVYILNSSSNDVDDASFSKMRRFVIELAIWLMKLNGKYALEFKKCKMGEALENVEETTSEHEQFNVFSAGVGLGQNISLFSMIDTAMNLLESQDESSS